MKRMLATLVSLVFAAAMPAAPVSAADDTPFYGYCRAVFAQAARGDSVYLTPLFRVTRHAVSQHEMLQTILSKPDEAIAPWAYADYDMIGQFKASTMEITRREDKANCYFSVTKERLVRTAREDREIESKYGWGIDQKRLRDWRPKAEARFPMIAAVEEPLF